MSPVVQISYPPELPVSLRRDDIAAAIRDHQVVIVAGETGSGKTTQLPKICLELGRGAGREHGGGLIGHTQPRRIAARSVAERIAEELGTELGELVGYQVRFTDKTSRASRVKLMTDGILLAELQRDRQLKKYDTLIIDEAHERSLNIDFLLGYLKRLLPRRPDLKVIITSATIDVERFAEHFDAPVVEVSGRTYPVEVRYRPLLELPEEDEEGEPVQRDQTEAIVDAVRELSAEGPGDILVFLPGEREIRDAAEVVSQITDRIEVVPLYSRLSAAEQHRVFSSHPSTVRRVVLATNVAETSLTVPGIRYVVDTGLARISRYSLRTKVQRLPIEPISQASANQRAGRCGRVADGIAIRLYSEEDFEGRPEFTDPEILRTNLASVILQMASLGLGDLARFPFVEPPDRRNVTAGVQLLEELGALGVSTPLDQPGRSVERSRDHRPNGPRLTRLGRRLARLPIDPRLGRMILEAERLGCVREVIVIAAALSIQDPRERPAEQQAQADQLHARFKDESSDFLTWLNLWRHLKRQQRELSGSAFRRMCKREHLNYLRVREWQDFESQLRQVCKEMRIELGHPADQPDADGIHQALLSGLLSHIGALEEREKPRPGERPSGRRPMREYVGARGARFAIFPGSTLKGRNPAFVMAGELVETSRLWGRQCAAIDPEWAERLGAHLVKRSWSEPHWSAKRAAVMAHEKVTLYGVPLVADRLVNFGKVDAELARELFIRHALVYGEWQGAARHRFWAHNQRLLEEAEELEHRARRRDIVVDEHTLFDFYDARVGREVVSGAHFDQWWKRERQKRPDLLTFDPAMLTHQTAEEIREADFPTQWRDSEDEGLTFPISYHFEPGTADDGITIEVPVATLNRVDADDFSWLVPGLREELVTELIRSLPKQLRVNFVPAPNKAREFLAAVPPGEEPLLDALERWCRSTTGVVVPREAWDWSKVPAHLQPTYRVVDDAGREAARGKDLEALKEPLRPAFADAIAEVAADAGVSATGQTSWTFGTLEESFVQRRAGHEVKGYPALVDEGKSAGVQVFGSAEEAAAHHRLGVRRLVLLALDGFEARSARTSTSELEKLGVDQRSMLALAGSPYSSAAELLDDIRAALVGSVVDARPVVRDEAAYDALVAAARTELDAQLPFVIQDVVRVLDAWRAADKVLSGRADLMTLPALTDMRAQVSRLMAPGFVGEAGPAVLREYPRYLAAVVHRRERLESQVARDRQLMDQIADLQQAWLHRVEALPEGMPLTASLREARWLLEEYRVSLWAQHLGTRQPVSDQRIRKALGSA
ncbi:ATP-dependent RNA helicase HrpA [Nocardioides gansuensis]|uniref:ATP-dependent RNA helicase HrpA n=1 Tax=Nocardioides gansuensis TaxID=2138300 RepID=A0A2T8F7R2_9ACTN|nr:ATP-dependent RNA helicase HrpA [Nocardioides gansuensis]PVG81761.1 ATP-dependent RNA helicase HrpA [Nocardioides gansuensis]